jgi:hypothetical protein
VCFHGCWWLAVGGWWLMWVVGGWLGGHVHDTLHACAGNNGICLVDGVCVCGFRVIRRASMRGKSWNVRGISHVGLLVLVGTCVTRGTCMRGLGSESCKCIVFIYLRMIELCH